MSTQKNEHNPEPELKPCPFCGGSIDIDCFIGDGFRLPRVTFERIRCKKCRFESEPEQPGCHKPDLRTRWNRRITPPTDTTGMVDGVWTDGKPLGDSFENPQPDYKDLWDAFVKGAQEARMNPTATNRDFNRAADAYCKLLHSQKAPEFFESLTRSGAIADTTGSGREGETDLEWRRLTALAKQYLAERNEAREKLVAIQSRKDCHVLRLENAKLTAQVEALMRAAKEFEKQVARRLWTSDDGVNIRDSDPGDYIDDDPALATAWSLFRAAIDSAQRQEGSKVDWPAAKPHEC